MDSDLSDLLEREEMRLGRDRRRRDAAADERKGRIIVAVRR